LLERNPTKAREDNDRILFVVIKNFVRDSSPTEDKNNKPNEGKGR
jgi:hypothetical protein